MFTNYVITLNQLVNYYWGVRMSSVVQKESITLSNLWNKCVNVKRLYKSNLPCYPM